jgi:hypothetical protein
VAGLGHWLIGSVDWYIVGALLLGSLPGISIGSYVAARISDRFLLPVLASILVLIGLRLITSETNIGCTVRMPIAGDGGAYRSASGLHAYVTDARSLANNSSYAARRRLRAYAAFVSSSFANGAVVAAADAPWRG